MQVSIMRSDNRNRKYAGLSQGVNLPSPRSLGWMGEQIRCHNSIGSFFTDVNDLTGKGRSPESHKTGNRNLRGSKCDASRSWRKREDRTRCRAAWRGRDPARHSSAWVHRTPVLARWGSKAEEQRTGAASVCTRTSEPRNRERRIGGSVKDDRTEVVWVCEDETLEQRSRYGRKLGKKSGKIYLTFITKPWYQG